MMLICRQRGIVICLVITAMLLLLSSGTVTAEMRIFELKHRSAAELAEPVRSMLSRQAKVSAYRHSLAVRAASGELDDVAKLIEILDRPQRMLRVSVAQGRVEDTSSRDLSGSGRVKNDSTSINFGRRHQEYKDGGSIFVSTGSDEMNLYGQNTTRHATRVADQFVSVLEGEEARISIGRSVPYTSRMRSFCRHHTACSESVEYKDVDTGFIVLPEIYGDLVQLEINPFLHFLDPEKPRQIVFQESNTRVRIPLGQWYDLGGHLGVQDDVAREILGSSQQSTSIDGSIRLKIDLQ